jgi:2-methylisocitrate lyase-like PEP mutase family enzyme
MDDKRGRLAQRLKQPGLVVAPGVFELISAKIADGMGFDCLYVTGYGVVASHLGLPDAGLATYSDMVSRVGLIASITRTPLIADGDTGYGGLLNVQQTVRGYEAAGACAIQLEDQDFPKKCGHMLDRRVIPADDMAAKIRVAVERRVQKRARFLDRHTLAHTIFATCPAGVD